MHNRRKYYPILLLVLLASCIDTRKAVYFNDVAERGVVSSLAGLEPVIRANDLLSIQVSSKDLASTAIFNAPNAPVSANGAPITGLQQAAGYLVDQQGSINFPMLGQVSAAGKSKKTLEQEIGKALVDKQLLFDPIVNIRYLNYRVTVLGEVARPGVVQVPSEQISILEAIGLAGDLTVYGKRENVLLIRQEGGQKRMERINLNSSQLLSSPYYYLQSNDVIYVEPEKAKVATGTRGQQLLPYIISGVSIVALVLTAIIR